MYSNWAKRQSSWNRFWHLEYSLYGCALNSVCLTIGFCFPFSLTLTHPEGGQNKSETELIIHSLASRPLDLAIGLCPLWECNLHKNRILSLKKAKAQLLRLSPFWRFGGVVICHLLFVFAHTHTGKIFFPLKCHLTQLVLNLYANSPPPPKPKLLASNFSM